MGIVAFGCVVQGNSIVTNEELMSYRAFRKTGPETNGLGFNVSYETWNFIWYEIGLDTYRQKNREFKNILNAEGTEKPYVCRADILRSQGKLIPIQIMTDLVLDYLNRHNISSKDMDAYLAYLENYSGPSCNVLPHTICAFYQWHLVSLMQRKNITHIAWMY